MLVSKSTERKVRKLNPFFSVAGSLALAVGFNSAANAQTYSPQLLAPSYDAGEYNNPVSWSQFLSDAQKIQFDKVKIKGNQVSAYRMTDNPYRVVESTRGPSSDQSYSELKSVVPIIEFEDPPAPVQVISNPQSQESSASWLNYVSTAGEIALVGLLGYSLFGLKRHKKARDAKVNNVISQETYRSHYPHYRPPGTSAFDEVAGCDEAKEEMQEFVEFLKTPHKFTKLGAKIPKGALLVGPPGTGKTLLARTLAKEAGVPFHTISGSNFVEMYVGVGASRVRDLFEKARKNMPCVIFIDEIDAVGKKRSNSGSGNDEREQTLNQLLVEMDGFDDGNSIIVIAATNRVDTLDPALLRPGRFDRMINVDLPDVKGREKILHVHTKNKKLAPDVQLERVARSTQGFSGAELGNLANEAAILAARRNSDHITPKDLAEARDKIMMGAERKSFIQSDEEKQATAFHEAGHTLVALHEMHSHPLDKVSIVPRRRSLGVTNFLPIEGGVQGTRAQFIASLCVAMGGRAAEEIAYGKEHVSAGAAGDIQSATEIARAMITQYGMSEQMGMVRYAFDPSLNDGFAAAAGARIEQEVKTMIDEAYEHVMAILTNENNREALYKLTEELLKEETMTDLEVRELVTVERIEGSKLSATARPDPFKERANAIA